MITKFDIIKAFDESGLTPLQGSYYEVVMLKPEGSDYKVETKCGCAIGALAMSRVGEVLESPDHIYSVKGIEDRIALWESKNIPHAEASGIFHGFDAAPVHAMWKSFPGYCSGYRAGRDAAAHFGLKVLPEEHLKELEY